MEAEILEVYQNEKSAITMLLIDVDGTQIRVRVQEETVIKNWSGWRVDGSKVFCGKQVKICVGSTVHYEPIVTYHTCYEMWVR